MRERIYLECFENKYYIGKIIWPREGISNAYTHQIYLEKPSRQRKWTVETGCIQDGWAIHGHYGYHMHDRKKIWLDITKVIFPDDPEKTWVKVNSILFKEGIKHCWD